MIYPIPPGIHPDTHRCGCGGVLTMPWVFYGFSGDVLEEKREGLRRFADAVIAKM